MMYTYVCMMSVCLSVSQESSETNKEKNAANVYIYIY